MKIEMDAVIVARDIVKFGRLYKIPTGWSRIQNMLFIIYGKYLSETGSLLFNDKFFAYQDSIINKQVHSWIRKHEKWQKVGSGIAYPEKHYVIASNALHEYRFHSNKELSDLLMSKDSPWDITWSSDVFGEIPNREIKKFFDKM